MNCDLARQALNEWVDGERPREPWALLAHYVACPGCRTIRAVLSRQRRALRTLPVCAPPVELRDRILFAAGEPVVAGSAQRSPRKPGLMLKAVAGVVVVVWLLIAAPFSNRRLMAADVRAAVGRVNVWHLTGWKLVGGQRVPWEIWGRRSPFFYREQLGTAVTLDDGTQRLQLIPPEARSSHGFLLRAASRPGDENTGWTYEAMFRRWVEAPLRFAESRETVLFNFNSGGMEGLGSHSDYLYTVSKRNSLPIRYEVRRHDAQGRVTVAEVLTAEYPWRLSGTAMRQEWPGGVRRIDTLTAPPPRQDARGRSATRNGVTVRVEPLRMDGSGQVLIRARGWLGGEPLGRSPELGWNVNGPGATEGGDATWPVMDDQGRLYIEVRPDDITELAPSGDLLSLYVPVEPLPLGASLPKSLHLVLHISPRVMQRVSGVAGQVEGRGLLTESFDLSVDLPGQPEPLDPEPFLDPQGRERFRALEPEPVSAAIARSRAWYYTRYDDRRDRSPKARSRIRQSIRWSQRYLELMPETTTRAQLQRFDIARWWAELGEPQNAEEVLRQMIEISRRQPHMAGYYRKLAEGELGRLRRRNLRPGRDRQPPSPQD